MLIIYSLTMLLLQMPLQEKQAEDRKRQQEKVSNFCHQFLLIEIDFAWRISTINFKA